uniref:Predicted gene 10663 n=1 Tax=Mus spicilegus TaxID=10103 RepID=A0A8C6HB31_MUSSI
ELEFTNLCVSFLPFPFFLFFL